MGRRTCRGVSAGGLWLMLAMCGCGDSGEIVNLGPFPKLPANAGPMDADPPREFTVTKSGLKYRLLRKVLGTAPTQENVVTVHYQGWLDNGRVFDSSYSRGEPTSFPLTRVVAGWTEGLQLAREGGMIELEIPYQLGYGPEGKPPTIPPKATLHFVVELLRVKPPDQRMDEN